MRVLFLTQIVPYPPDAGPRIKTWNVLRHLVEQGHKVTLVTFARAEEEKHLPVLQAICERVIAVPMRRSRLADLFFFARSLFTGRPFLVERDDLPALRKPVRQMIADGGVDVVHADQVSMVQFALPRPRSTRVVFDAHNATWSVLERMAELASPWMRPVLRLECERMKRYEAYLLDAADDTLAVSEIDRTALLAAAQRYGHAAQVSERIHVIPIAIDAHSEPVLPRPSSSYNIVTLGTLRYAPNANGIRWFLREVFPLIQQAVPQASLTIIGKDPPADFTTQAETSGGRITVTGYVPDLTPHLQRAALVVVPVLAGGGMRVRILEAFARGLPVVTTTIGLEGIEAQPGEDVLVKDSPQDFAQAVIDLLQDPQLQAHLSANGRALALKRYDWRAVLDQLSAVYAHTGSVSLEDA